jgi:hypothetical protein
LIKAGHTVCFSEATVKDESGKLLSYGTSKQLITRGAQTMARALEVMGCAGLPPKFL